MIVCEALKLIYVDVPKTGSVTVDTILKEHFNGKLINNSKNGQTKHMRTVPGKYAYYRRIATVRHPYSRMISQYNYNVENGNLDKVAAEFKIVISNFDDFLNFSHYVESEYPATETKHNIAGWFSCSKYLELLKPEFIIQTEDLAAQFNNLWFVKTPITLPLTNESKSDKFELSDAQKQKIQQIAEKDFELYNYKK